MLRAALRVALLAVLHVTALTLAGADLGHSFAPQAASAVASRVGSALPLAARWDPVWNETAAGQVGLFLEAEDLDPETYGYLHRYVAGSGTSALGTGDAALGAALAVGVAPRELAAAAARLEDAFEAERAIDIVGQSAKVAIASADLCDPFLTTRLDLEEVPGARALFSDAIDDPGLPAEAAIAATPHPQVTLATARDVAIAAAATSAARRAVIEAAVRAGDRETVKRLRDTAFADAVSLARAVVVAAWEEAGRPALGDAIIRPGTIDMRPNPAARTTALIFALPRRADIRVELYDIAGRRIWASEIGTRAPGPNRIEVGPEVLDLLPAGVFLPRITAGAYRAQGRLVHIRD